MKIVAQNICTIKNKTKTKRKKQYKEGNKAIRRYTKEFAKNKYCGVFFSVNNLRLKKRKVNVILGVKGLLCQVS